MAICRGPPTGLRVAFQVWTRQLEIMEGFGKGKICELDVDRKLRPVNGKMDGREAERVRGLFCGVSAVESVWQQYMY